MLTVKEVLSHVELVKGGHEEYVPCFIEVLCNRPRYLFMWDIEKFCPDEIIPLLLKHSDYVTGIYMQESLKRKIVVQLIHDLLEKNTDLHVYLSGESPSWIIGCRFRLRDLCVFNVTDICLHTVGSLLNDEENEIEILKVNSLSPQITNSFLSYLKHPNCRVKKLRIGTYEFDDTILRNTLIRRIGDLYSESEWIVWPYHISADEFETMIRVMHGLRKLHESLHVDLWRVIFYFL